MKRAPAILLLLALGCRPAVAALEWAVWGPPSGNTSTGVFGNGQQVVLYANFTGIANGEPAGLEYTSDPQLPGRPDNTNPPFQRIMSGPPSTVLAAGTTVVDLDLSGISVDASTTFGLADHKSAVYYVLQLLDASLAPLPLSEVVVTPYNITYTNGSLIADLNTLLNITSMPGLLSVDSLHDGGGTYSPPA